MACTFTPLAASSRRSWASLTPASRQASYIPAVSVIAPSPALPAASIRGSRGVPISVPQHSAITGDSSVLGMAAP